MSFFAGAHHFDINNSSMNNVHRDMHQTINNDNRHTIGSHNTYTTTNTNSYNNKRTQVDERSDNRRTNTYNHTQKAMFGNDFAHSEPNLPHAHAQWDEGRFDYGHRAWPGHVKYSGGEDSYARNRSPSWDGFGGPRRYENLRYDFVAGGGGRGGYSGPNRPGRYYEPAYDYPPQPRQSSHDTYREERPPTPPPAPASAPPAPLTVESAEAYRSRNPYDQTYFQSVQPGWDRDELEGRDGSAADAPRSSQQESHYPAPSFRRSSAATNPFRQTTKDTNTTASDSDDIRDGNDMVIDVEDSTHASS